MVDISKRDKLIRTALELFNKYGFHSIGVDLILKEAGISKKTMYHHFKSKNELILAVIRFYDETFRNFLMREVEARASQPLDQLLVIFDVLERWCEDTNFQGCIAIKAISEFTERDKAIRRSCVEFKRLINEYVIKISHDAGIESPEEVAGDIMILIEGVIAMGQIAHDSSVAQRAKSMTKRLLRKYYEC